MFARLVAALSSAYTVNGIALYPAQNVIDGDYATLCGSAIFPSNWISIEVADHSASTPEAPPAAVPIGDVRIYNRRGAYQTWLGELEVWVGYLSLFSFSIWRALSAQLSESSRF